MILTHFFSISRYFTVGNPFKINAAERVIRRKAFRENVPVQIYFFQISKNSLTVFRNGEGVADTTDIIGSIRKVAQYQIRKIDKGIVINAALPVMAGQRDLSERFFHLSPICFQTLQLIGSTFQLKLFDIIIGITDLVDNAQRDQDIGRKIPVHMGMQIGMELAVAADIRFDNGFLYPEAIILRLAHQRFGNGRNRSFQLNGSVRIDICNFGIAQPENIHPAVIAVIIAGDFIPDNFQTILIFRRFQST